MGCAGEKKDNEGADSEACKEVVEKFNDEKGDLTAFATKYAEVLGREPIEEWQSDAGKELLAVAEAGCKFQKTFSFESTCAGKFLYLIRGEDGSIKELCVTDITDPEI